VRATCTIRFQDHAWADRDVDPYWDARSYKSIVMSQGTYWGKWLARNPYYQNRTIDVYTGYLVDGVAIPANFDKRTYVVDKIDGPDNAGVVTITAKDPLKLADDQRTQVPVANTGVLLADITALGSTLTLSPAGIGDSESYPTTGWVAIGNEIMKISGRTGDVLTIYSHGSFNTVSVAHSAGDAVQICKVWQDVPVIDIIYELLVTYSFINPALIPDHTYGSTTSAWALEFATWIPGYTLSAVLFKPEGAQTLLNELMEQCLCCIWWDERLATIRFRAIKPPAWNEITALNEDYNILAGSPSTTTDPSQRVSEVFVYFAQHNPTLDIDRKDNYDCQELGIDPDAEGDDEYGEQRIKEIFSRWFAKANLPEAYLLTARLINKYRNNPRFMQLDLDAKDSALWTGDNVTISSRCLQDAAGVSIPYQMQVLSVTETSLGAVFHYELQDSYFQGRYGFIAPVSLAAYEHYHDYWGVEHDVPSWLQDQYTASRTKPAEDIPDYILATEAQRIRYGFITTNAGTMSNGDGGYKII
jgi:hypothetical protein